MLYYSTNSGSRQIIVHITYDWIGTRGKRQSSFLLIILLFRLSSTKIHRLTAKVKCLSETLNNVFITIPIEDTDEPIARKDQQARRETKIK